MKSERKQAVSVALMPKLRFPEFHGASGFNPTPLSRAFLRITNGKANAQDHVEGGEYPLFDRSEVVKASNEWTFDAEAVILPGEGMAFRPRYFEGKFNLHQRAYALMECQGLAKFFFYALDYAKDALALKAVKSTVLSLRLPIIEKFVVHAPKSAEQQKIADCLTSLDEVIATQGRKVEALKAHKRGLMQQLFPREGETRPRLRFPEFRDATEWKVVRIASICRVQRGKFSHRPRNDPRFFGGPYAFIQTGDVVRANGGAVVASQSLNDLGLSVSKLFKPTIVLITIAANIGDTALLDTEACFTDSVVGLIPKANFVTPRFLESTMRLKKEYLNQVATTGAQKNINNEILEALDVLVPSINEQLQIDGCLSSLDIQITAESHQLTALKTHKLGLMQQLFPSSEGTAA